MPVPTIEKQADIPKGFEADYEERDGAWHWIDPAVKLKESLAKEREKREAAESLAKKAAADARKAQETADAHKAGLSEAELKKLHDDIEAGIRAEYAPKLTEGEAAASENRTLKLTNVVMGMLDTAQVLPDKRARLWKLHADEFDLTSDGKPMVKGEPGKDVAKHVAALVKQYPEWVAGTKASGGGAAGVTLPAGGGGADQVGKVDPTQRLRAAHEAGVTA